MRLVIDASVAVKWSISEAGSEAATDLLAHPLVAPDLFLAEFGNALTKKLRRREISLGQAWQALEEGPQRVELFSSRLLLPAAFELSIGLHHSVYDCYYLALAEALDCPLVTADAVFVAKVRAADSALRIHLLGEEIGE